MKCWRSATPTIALLAVDRAEHDGMLMLQTLAHSSSPPATLLIGSADGRLLSSITRAAEGRSLKVIGVTKEPLDALELEGTLAPYLHRPPPIPREELLQALREHQLMVQYQPKVSLSPRWLENWGCRSVGQVAASAQGTAAAALLSRGRRGA